MKRLLTLFLTLLIMLAVVIAPMQAFATVTTYSGTIAILPGNPRSSAPVYNYAWLDNLVVRDDAMAVTGNEIVPRPEDYQSSHTYDEFIKEVEQYSVLFDINEHTVAYAYEEVITAMYYLCASMGMTDSMEPMRAYLVQNGISLEANEDLIEKAKIGVVYAALKYDAVYTLYGKDVEIPIGSTVDQAAIAIVAALTGATVPSGTDTLTQYAVHAMTTYVKQFEQLPISEDPDAAEVFHWVKIITAAANDYQVPVEVYSETSAAQKEYVDFAYYASILTTLYDVNINPVYLVIATQSSDELALQKLILRSMLEEKGVDYPDDISCEELFDLACSNGCLPLENELYCDILKYDITVAQECGKIWFTPFPLAGQIENSDEKYVTMKLQGEDIAPSSTTAVYLDTAKKTEKVILEVFYNSPSRSEHATYEFNIIKDASLNGVNSSAENNMVAQVQDYVNTIVPTENEKVNQIMDNVFSAVDGAVTPDGQNTTQNSLLTTFGFDEGTATTQKVQGSTEATSRFDFNYLDDLIGGAYQTDENGNIITTTSFSYDITSEKADENIIEKTVETVKDNPEIVVAPTGLVALGALAGYLMTKKHRDSEAYLQQD